MSEWRMHGYHLDHGRRVVRDEIGSRYAVETYDPMGVKMLSRAGIEFSQAVDYLARPDWVHVEGVPGGAVLDRRVRKVKWMRREANK